MTFTQMERAGRIIARWQKTGDAASTNELARAAWRVAAGKKVANHTFGASLVRTHLIVEVEDQIWRRQLFALRFQLLKNLSDVLGPGVVEDLEFRVAPKRFGAGREEVRRKPAARVENAAPDEADGISDPTLRLLYRKARKRASA